MNRVLRFAFVATCMLLPAALVAATPPSHFPERESAPSEISQTPPTYNDAGLGLTFDAPGPGFWTLEDGTLKVGINECSITITGLDGDPPYEYTVDDGDVGTEPLTGEAGSSVVGPLEVGDFRVWFGTSKSDTSGLDASGLSSSEQAIIFGFGGNDDITGGPGADFLFGLEGLDEITGGAGNDLILCGSGDDEADGQDGDDRIWGEDGDDTLWGRKGGDWLILGDGAGQIAVGGGSTSNPGDNGFDKIWGGSGKDEIYGDEYQVTAHTTGGDDNIWTGGGDDEVHGGPGVDTIYVAEFTATGNDGKIRIYGDGGADVIHLEKNKGIIRGEWESDEFSSAGDDDIKVYDSWESYNISCGMGHDQVYYGGKHADEIYGCGGNDTIDGGEGADRIEGDGGTTGATSPGGDYLYGNDGDESGATAVIDGGDGNDFLWGGLGDDKILGGDGGDTIYGETNLVLGETAGNDTIVGGDGGDTIWGEGGNDTIYGQGGNDTIYGDWVAGSPKYPQEGADKINGGADGDTIHGGGGNDFLAGAGGVDTIYGDNGNDLIWGDDDNDTLYGGDGTGQGDSTGEDEIDGGNGEDKLYGENGDDTLIDRSGTKRDTLSGGAGSDTLDCFDNHLPDPEPGAAPDTVYGDNDLDVFWIDDVDVNDVDWQVETATAATSGLNLSTANKLGENP
ncbi:MAG: hypothetical protein K8I27_04730 [Planctomycetes bacterium]|nr:hypothetical protein [Planctomycetota bacterium]